LFSDPEELVRSDAAVEFVSVATSGLVDCSPDGEDGSFNADKKKCGTPSWRSDAGLGRSAIDDVVVGIARRTLADHVVIRRWRFAVQVDIPSAGPGHQRR